jgi:hypothetical protein
MPNPLPFPGETYHGPSPRPETITSPSVVELSDAVDHYGATQCRDDIRDGDVLVIRDPSGAVDCIGVMCSAWPIVARGNGEPYGFHELSADADIRALGANPWGRLGWITVCPKDAPRYPVLDFIPPRAGADYTASFELAGTVR